MTSSMKQHTMIDFYAKNPVHILVQGKGEQQQSKLKGDQSNTCEWLDDKDRQEDE